MGISKKARDRLDEDEKTWKVGIIDDFDDLRSFLDIAVEEGLKERKTLKANGSCI